MEFLNLGKKTNYSTRVFLKSKHILVINFVGNFSPIAASQCTTDRSYGVSSIRPPVRGPGALHLAELPANNIIMQCVGTNHSDTSLLNSN